MDLASGYSDNSANPFGYVNNAVANNQANMLANYNANLAYVGGQNQASLDNAYGPQGFGGQTAYYAGQGAAYGRATGGYGGYGGMNDPFSPVGGYNALDAQFDRAAAQKYLDANPDVAEYAAKNSLEPLWAANRHAITQGGSEGRNTFGLGATPFNDYGGGANPGGFSPSPNYPGGSGGAAASDPASQAYFNAYPDVAKSGMSAQQHWNVYGREEGRNSFGLDASGRDQLAQVMQGSNSPAYQGNPYYLPGAMPGGGSPTQGGGGFGAPGFGIGQTNYTGQPGFGLGIGSVGPGSVGDAYGVKKDGGLGFGFGGLTDSPFVNLPGS